jgi:stage III sporulation protein AB
MKQFGGSSMVKIIGCILIILASTCAGFVFSENLKKRLKQLRELLRAIVQLENEIVYTHTPLPEAFNNVSEKSRDVINILFLKASKNLFSNKSGSVYLAFNDAIAENKDSINLLQSDIDILLDLSKALGCSDLEGHKNVFLLAKNELNKKIIDAEDTMKKNSKMYKYLGFSFGAVISILLI